MSAAAGNGARLNGALLSVRDLAVEFVTDRGVVRAVDGISFDLNPGDTLGLVGESGCGKTVTGLALLGLIPSPPGRIAGGSIEFAGRDLVTLKEDELRKLRGSEISMIFQEPMTALNPVFTVSSQMVDVLRLHQQLTRRQARATAIELLARVGIPEPEQRIDDYPFQLSGGMRQRVMIAMALSCEPQVLVADEPTTALDVTTQAQVLELMTSLQQELGTAMILITHDLGVVAETCQSAVVMYCGRIVEQSPVAELFAHPHHPYTAGLLRSIPRLGAAHKGKLPVIPGMVPDLLHLPAGCRFADRCDKVQRRCRESIPELTNSPSAHSSSAHFGAATREQTGSLVACYEPD